MKTGISAPDFQETHPCYVLVPQYSYITVDNEWQTMPEVDETIELLESILSEKPVDKNRLYTTGQSMGNTVLPEDSKIPANAPGAVHMASFNHALTINYSRPLYNLYKR